jgi:hypothetical protein
MVMIVKEPGIDRALAQGGLNGGKVHEQKSIVSACFAGVLQTLNDFVDWVQQAGSLHRAHLLREGLHEGWPMLEEHALEGFQFQPELTDLFLLLKNGGKKVVVIHPHQYIGKAKGRPGERPPLRK